MTKKIIAILFLFLSINILLAINQKKDLKPVFDEINSKYENEYKIYNLTVKDISITSRNINKYFSGTNIKVLGVYPKINYLYEKKLSSKLNYYQFKETTINKNIKKFEESYKKILDQNGFKDEINKIELNGINLIKIKIYCSNKDLKELLNNNPKFIIEE
ncbi:MAG: hypothetical protein PHI05_02820 [Bacilli bacterium]|nr:hypothetical protein [Bacilli bacterium]MDD4547655.1 hypothetical protein [Bacilli bacterium]